MAILRYIPVTATATPMNPDSSAPPPFIPVPRQAKVLVPETKKPMKGSTGGAPPKPTKIRRSWGGEGEDPLTSDDYIWNKDFMPRMKRLFEDPESSAPYFLPEEEDSGFLSLSRVMSLDNMELDLSKVLTAAPVQPVIETQVEAQIESSSVKTLKWAPTPTRRQQEKWDRARKAATISSEVTPPGDPEVLAAQAREEYFKLKRKLQILTLGVGGVGLVTSYVAYSPEIAASFGAGFLGSLVYIRMLGNSVDALADGARGLLKGASGQPRLLVPVVLVMIYNRWNGILVPEYGFMHLELIPILVGFFSYKMATFIQTFEDAVTVRVKKDPSLS